MKKSLSLLVIGAVLATAIVPEGKAQSIVGQFRTELTERIGTRKNAGAASVIARTIKRFVRRDSNSVVAFARIGNRFLQQTVRANLRGRTALQILGGTARGFLGVATLDSRFERFVRLVIRRLPGSQKTDAVLTPIAARLVSINRSRGGAESQTQQIYDLVFGAGGRTPPNVS